MTDTPIDRTAHPDEQAYQALTYADGQGWLAFEHMTPGRPSERRYVMTVAPITGHRNVGQHRELPAAAVLPFVAALADVRGVGHLFPL